MTVMVLGQTTHKKHIVKRMSGLTAMVMATITIIGGRAGEFSANIFEPRKILEKILRSLSCKQQQKTSRNKRKQADHGLTGGSAFDHDLFPLPRLPPLVKQYHFLDKGISIFLDAAA